MRGCWFGFVGVVLLATGGGVAAEGGSDEAGSRAADHVEATCAGCHAAGIDAAVRKRVSGKGADAPEVLDGFLSGHYVADASLRADVVAYLLARLDATAEAE